MRGSVLALIVGVVVLLLVGLFFTTSGGLPIKEQVSSPEASTARMTSDEGVLFAIMVVGVLGAIGMMAVTIYIVMYFMNREIARVQQQPAQQFELLSMGPRGNTTGALLANNALYIVIGAGMIMTAVALAVILLA